MVQITKSGKLKKVLRYWPFYVMALPGLIYLFINNYIPMTGLILALERYDVRKGIYGSPKCGLENFQFLFNTSDAWMITRNTILYNVVFILLGNICAILVANCLNEIKGKTSKKYIKRLFCSHTLYRLSLWPFWPMLFWREIQALSIKRFWNRWVWIQFNFIENQSIGRLFLPLSNYGNLWDIAV